MLTARKSPSSGSRRAASSASCRMRANNGSAPAIPTTRAVKPCAMTNSQTRLAEGAVYHSAQPTRRPRLSARQLPQSPESRSLVIGMQGALSQGNSSSDRDAIAVVVVLGRRGAFARTCPGLERPRTGPGPEAAPPIMPPAAPPTAAPTGPPTTAPATAPPAAPVTAPLPSAKARVGRPAKARAESPMIIPRIMSSSISVRDTKKTRGGSDGSESWPLAICKTSGSCIPPNSDSAPLRVEQR